jgi:hypothetical protein
MNLLMINTEELLGAWHFCTSKEVDDDERFWEKQSNDYLYFTGGWVTVE